jgi:hypothetical protein
MTCCDERQYLKDQKYLVKGYDGPNRVEFYTMKKNQTYYYSTYIRFCPFCGEKL